MIEPNIKECSQCITLKKENEDLINDITKIREDSKQANRRVSQIAKLNKKLNCKMQQLQKDLTGAQQNLKTFNGYKPYRVRQMLKRKLQSITNVKKNHDEKSEEIEKLEDKIREVKSELKKVKKQKNNMQSYHRNRKPDQIEIDDGVGTEMVDNLRNELAALEYQNGKLQDQNESITNTLINTKKDNKTYSSDVRKTIYSLSNAQVAVNRLEDVIRTVCKNMANREIGPLPDSGTCAKIIREMGALARLQCAEILKDEQHTTLMYDGTTKKKFHYGEVQFACSSTKVLTAGMQLMASGTAESYSKAILDTINDIGRY